MENSGEQQPVVRVLGAGAGGGSPQWNCNCEICKRVRDGDGPRRTQTSLAVSADGRRWALINASPDLREQIAKTPSLHPQHSGRHSPIEAVVLTGGEVDQVTGLLTMREGEPFSVYASGSVHETLAQSPIFDALDRETVPRRSMQLDETTEIAGADGQKLGISVTAFSVPGKVPLYEETPGETPEIGVETEDNVALRVDLGETHFFFVPGCADITPGLKERLQGAPLVFFDGTLWSDDELVDAGLTEKTGQRMGHVSISGDGGVLESFSDADIERKVLIHINNSNPVLLDDTEERQTVEAAGWDVAYDGWTIEL